MAWARRDLMRPKLSRSPSFSNPMRLISASAMAITPGLVWRPTPMLGPGTGYPHITRRSERRSRQPLPLRFWSPDELPTLRLQTP